MTTTNLLRQLPEELLPILIASAFVGVLVSAGFLLLGAGIAGVENSNCGKALGSTVLGGVASIAASFALGLVLRVGPASGFLGGFIMAAVVTQATLRTTFGKALGAQVLCWAFAVLLCGAVALPLFEAGKVLR